MKFIFDIETNGLLSNSSLLSITYFIIDNKDNIIEKDTRYYYPKEDYNPKAISINGLTEKVITKQRKTAKYSKYFDKDYAFFIDLINKYNIDMFIAHNISFDIQWMNYILNKIVNKNYNLFCTMHANIKVQSFLSQISFK